MNKTVIAKEKHIIYTILRYQSPGENIWIILYTVKLLNSKIKITVLFCLDYYRLILKRYIKRLNGSIVIKKFL